MKPKPGALVISLDFELYWGMRDVVTLADYGQHILGVRRALPRLLDLFDLYRVRATWATVGLLFFERKTDLLAHLPAIRPAYHDQHLSPYGRPIERLGGDERSDPYHFGASLIRQIAARPDQEIATHTFSHYYCLEPGQGASAFRADLEAAQRAAARFDLSLTSIVFPRNQVNPAYLPICRALGLTAYRGNPPSRLYQIRGGADPRWQRALRLTDAYLDLSGAHAPPLVAAGPGELVNVPASRFLRPYSPALAWLEARRLARITAAMSHAAQTGGVFHLWWHPHNFGINLSHNLQFLRRILDQFTQLQKNYGMESLNMRDLARIHGEMIDNNGHIEANEVVNSV